MGGFCLLVELHWEGSAPVAGAAGLFLLPRRERGGHSEEILKAIKTLGIPGYYLGDLKRVEPLK